MFIALRLLNILKFNMYDIKSEHIEQGGARDFFADRARERGIAHRQSLCLARRLTLIAIIGVGLDVVGRITGYSIAEYYGLIRSYAITYLTVH